jgi:hypothetical protein
MNRVHLVGRKCQNGSASFKPSFLALKKLHPRCSIIKKKKKKKKTIEKAIFLAAGFNPPIQ